MKIFKQITANNITLNPYPFWRELAMSAYLWENEEILKIDDVILGEPMVLEAEIALKKGRQGRDGRIDLLAQYGMEHLAIIEIKKEEIDSKALKQLEGYLKQRQQIKNNRSELWKDEDTSPEKWIGVLVGTSISSELQQKFSSGYQYDDGNNNIPIAAITLQRFRGENGEIFVISDTYFNNNVTRNNNAIYTFKGQTYGKSRLVHQIVKSYIEKNPKITFAELEEKFPRDLQGSRGVFTTEAEALKIYKGTGHKRYYINPDEPIKLSDGSTIAVCNQWYYGNIGGFIDCARNLGFEITQNQ